LRSKIEYATEYRQRHAGCASWDFEVTDTEPKRCLGASRRWRLGSIGGVWGKLSGLRHSLRGKLLLLSLIVVSIPITTAGYLLEREGRQTLLQEKQERLFGLDRLLDAQLGSGFEELLADYAGDTADRDAMVRHLNARLAARTDQMADANPGVGVGYYVRALDAIVTYGPSAQYGGTVGHPIPPEHPGRAVMRSGKPAMEAGPQVRGMILNAMWPIVRDDRVQGYVWANQLSDDVNRQTAVMDRAIIGVTVAGVLLGILLTQAMSRGIARDVRTVTDGLVQLRTDLHHSIPPPPGEIGEIAAKVNDMAQALLDAQSLTEDILQSIADGVIAIDRAGRITAINPAARHMIGVAAEDAIGRPYNSLFDPTARFSSVLLDTLEHGCDHIDVAVEMPLPRQSLDVSASSSLLRDSHGTAIGAVVVLKDRTEQSRLRTQVMRADRLAALGELMAGVAHEIRNPLTSIRGFVQFLEDCDDVREWRRYSPQIIRQVDSLNRIIGELLEFGRSRPPAIRPVQLNDLVHEVTRLAGHKADVQMRLALCTDLPPIEADGEALKQALLNLVINAIQAIDTAGTVRIETRLEADGALVAVSISDDGTGIPPENLEKIFDPFFSTKPQGTGLGLAMVHQIVDAHHGTITMTSNAGTGTVATLRLPRLHIKKDAL
jgi:two-component system sensor histidine kinase AtoS